MSLEQRRALRRCFFARRDARVEASTRTAACHVTSVQRGRLGFAGSVR